MRCVLGCMAFYVIGVFVLLSEVDYAELLVHDDKEKHDKGRCNYLGGIQASNTVVRVHFAPFIFHWANIVELSGEQVCILPSLPG